MANRTSLETMLDHGSLRTSDGIPVTRGRPIRKNSAVVTCPFCGKRHVHGRLEGPRLSHCEDQSAAKEYYLVIVDL